MLAMLDTLMDISEAETGTMRLAMADVEIAALVSEIVELYEDSAEESGVSIAANVAAGLVVRADRDRLRQALGNLVDNAIKYTPGGGRVEGANGRFIEPSLRGHQHLPYAEVEERAGQLGDVHL